MKEEFSSTEGKFFGLSAKCYFINHREKIKRSHKGTPKSVILSADDYEQALFYDKVPKAKFNRIVVDERVGSCTTKKTEKRAVNPIYIKMHVGTVSTYIIGVCFFIKTIDKKIIVESFKMTILYLFHPFKTKTVTCN